MITSIYYYEAYRPYILKNDSVRSVPRAPSAVRRQTVAAAARGGGVNCLLNKSLKSEVVHYAQDITRNIVGLKDAANSFMQDMDEMNMEYGGYSQDDMKKWVEEDLEALTRMTNKVQDFAEKQPHSPAIKDFSQDIIDELYESQNVLAKVGIQMDAEGRISFNKNSIEKMSTENLTTALSQTRQVVGRIYDQTTKVLSIPMSEHMNFKNLNYYYNYRLGSIYNDTFKIIESGMVLDAVV